jgi:hypothetical protein
VHDERELRVFVLVTALTFSLIMALATILFLAVWLRREIAHRSKVERALETSTLKHAVKSAVDGAKEESEIWSRAPTAAARALDEVVGKIQALLGTSGGVFSRALQDPELGDLIPLIDVENPGNGGARGGLQAPTLQNLLAADIHHQQQQQEEDQEENQTEDQQGALTLTAVRNRSRRNSRSREH